MKVQTIIADIGVCNNDKRDTTKSFRSVKKCEIHIKGMVDICNPEFSVNGFDGYESCNYMYIPAWKRYYFLEPPKLDNYLMLWIRGHEDHLSTWWPYIKNKTVLIHRQENIWNPYIQDNQLPVRTERIIEYQKIGNIGNPQGQNIVLTVSGGYEEIVPSGKASKNDR